MLESQHQIQSGERKQTVHYQLGAPVLLYHEETDAFSSMLPAHRYPKVHAGTIHETCQRRNRLQTRWNYSIDLDQIKRVKMPKKIKPTDTGIDENKGKRQKVRQESSTRARNERISVDFDHLHYADSEYRSRRAKKSLQKERHALLLANNHRIDDHRELLENYRTYDYPYVPGQLEINSHQSKIAAIRLEAKRSFTTREFSLDRQLSSDPAYLAPFGMSSLLACQDQYKHRQEAIDTSQTDSIPFRPQQGNSLLILPCPCQPCSQRPAGERSWCLFHPKGKDLEHICVSNLIPPNGLANAGHLRTISKWESNLRRRNEMIENAQKKMPNTLCLDDSIIEIKQGGIWDVENRECTFVARTTMHISILSVTVAKPVLLEDQYLYEEDVCWGNYVIEERRRVDLRSLSPHCPSYYPVSLACHPKYGNACTSAKYAFVSHSDRGEYNIINQGIASSEGPVKHSIKNLKHISFIDFTSMHPMVLWSAAASYVRPALSPDGQYKQPMFGMGTSLYTVDLRNNSATFQWSPSAEEMTTEGIFSISGIMSDWHRENTVWVTSSSAGKTWEIDGRMPCRVINTWSLTSSCEDSSTTIPLKGLHGEGSLLTKTREANDIGSVNVAPVINVDTGSGAFGFHMYQQPINRPRFQTDSLECIATPGLDFKGNASIATSSVFALAEVSDELYTCGIAAFRMPFSSFVRDIDSSLVDFADRDSSIVCTITMSNNGDMHCHPLLESTRKMSQSIPCVSLPAGSKAIEIPQELDGVTKELEHKRWKPTGGMNLKLYLTNRCHTPKHVLSLPNANESSDTTKIFLSRKKIPHPSLQLKSGSPAYNFESIKCGISIAASDPKVECLVGDKPLVIPQKLVEKAKKAMAFHQDNAEHATTTTRRYEQARTDLSQGVLKNSSELWDEMESDEDGTW